MAAPRQAPSQPRLLRLVEPRLAPRAPPPAIVAVVPDRLGADDDVEKLRRDRLLAKLLRRLPERIHLVTDIAVGGRQHAQPRGVWRPPSRNSGVALFEQLRMLRFKPRQGAQDLRQMHTHRVGGAFPVTRIDRRHDRAMLIDQRQHFLRR